MEELLHYLERSELSAAEVNIFWGSSVSSKGNANLTFYLSNIAFSYFILYFYDYFSRNNSCDRKYSSARLLLWVRFYEL